MLSITPSELKSAFDSSQKLQQEYRISQHAKTVDVAIKEKLVELKKPAADSHNYVFVRFEYKDKPEDLRELVKRLNAQGFQAEYSEDDYDDGPIRSSSVKGITIHIE